MGYFNFYIIKKIINSFFNYIRKNKKFIIIFIVFVCILFIREKCFAVTTYDPIIDMYYQNQQQQLLRQNNLVNCVMHPYFRSN